ncbi:MBL fold metallo-hydrolase [Flavobacteriaceae bacterium F89]|uniref:MBL fold metallo-hydrolase n=1 Tax=Cerina litoralis TaxID=2874477 RepID=A0AAE3JUI1_9FLAO|nr:MBL fold metallo-hydrolase [Cerina litoralis]MCG2462422.1 MBL fold metallo-hydrolase [Cerina litoralis]
MNALIPALKKGPKLIEEMDRFIPEKEGFRLWWLGQSGYLLQWRGKRVLIDPYLSDSLTKKYAATEKPHIRMSELVLAPELLKNISIVTSSHNHTDHLDGKTLIPILNNNPSIKFIIPEANREFVSNRVQCDLDFPIGMNDDGITVVVNDFRFTGIPAKHNDLARDEDGNCKFMGYVIEFGPYRIYHSGDTLWFEGMEALLKPYRVDIAILPINGNDPSRKVAGNLNCKESANLGKAIDAKYVIPCHYDMFTFNTANVRDFVLEAAEIDQGYKVLRGGECFFFV